MRHLSVDETIDVVDTLFKKHGEAIFHINIYSEKLFYDILFDQDYDHNLHSVIDRIFFAVAINNTSFLKAIIQKEARYTVHYIDADSIRRCFDFPAALEADHSISLHDRNLAKALFDYFRLHFGSDTTAMKQLITNALLKRTLATSLQLMLPENRERLITFECCIKRNTDLPQLPIEIRDRIAFYFLHSTSPAKIFVAKTYPAFKKGDFSDIIRCAKRWVSDLQETPVEKIDAQTRKDLCGCSLDKFCSCRFPEFFFDMPVF